MSASAPIRRPLGSGGRRPRGIEQGDLIPGARIVTAANVVEYMVNSGAQTLSF